MVLKKNYTLLLFFCLTYVFSTGQIAVKDSLIKTESSSYIFKNFDRINVKFDLDSEIESFILKGPNNYSTDIRPNVSIKSKISFNYKFISFSVGYIPKFLPGNNDDDLKGKTNGFGLNLNLIFDHWVQGLKYSKVNGYYLENTKNFLPDWEEGEPYIKFPDLGVISFQGSTGYKFNPNFSLRAISTQTEIQKRNAGSFIPGLLYNYYDIDNRSNNPEQTSSQNSKSFEFLLDIAYYYTYVLKSSWYASLGLSPSLGVNYTNLLTRFPEGNVRTTYSNPIYRLNAHLGLGYNSERIFGGAEIKGYESFRNENNKTMTIQTNNLTYQIFIGYRFKTPKFLKKTVDQIEELLPL
ncbi:DUF4421 family protein [Namhaeicola litoreus]|uniref:DUF4421 family protein n=1 Tax=Namhaeicola litoreus TaxID=1052145 RepID=A0ABW3XZK3_9FLAO